MGGLKVLLRFLGCPGGILGCREDPRAPPKDIGVL